MLFTGFHAYWALGGRVGFGDGEAARSGDRAFATTWFFVGNLVVTGLGVVTAVIALAVLRPWGQKIPRWMLITGVTIGGVFLFLRGGLSIADELLRVTGLSDHGLTGQTTQEMHREALDDPDPSQYTIWSFRVIDAFFFVGSLLLFALTWCFVRRFDEPRLSRASEAGVLESGEVEVGV